MAGAGDLARMVPGFDFLQGLLKNAGAGMPNIGQWVAPTLDPQDLDKRIGELRTVQFWLEQNAKLIATTIQALEVQRMTLATLQSMNMPLADLGEALKIKVPAPYSPPAPTWPAPAPATAAAAPVAAPAAKAPAPPAVDPMQWWGALTQQFTELAAKAVKETTDGAATLAAAATRATPAAVTKTGAAPVGAKAGDAAAQAVAAARKTVARKAARKAAAPRKKTAG